MAIFKATIIQEVTLIQEAETLAQAEAYFAELAKEDLSNAKVVRVVEV